MFPLFCDLVAKNSVTVPSENSYISTLQNLEIEYSSLLEILPKSFKAYLLLGAEPIC